MRVIPPSMWQYLGTNTNGDCGPYTFYTSSRKKLIVFLKTWPKDPATYHQKLNRDRWRHAAIRWRGLDPATRQAWKNLAFRANLTISGYNLYMHYITGKGTTTVQTCQRIARIDVLTPTGPPLPYLTI